MKLNELLAFVTVVETGNITLAAERLNRVQSSISHRIRSLESSLDATLLDRKNEGCIPTEQGKILYEYALKMLNLADDCKHNITLSKRRRLTIKIGIIECLPPYVISALIDSGHDLGWDIDVSIGNTSSFLNAFDRHEYDAVIIGAGFSSPQHTRAMLLTSELVIITAKDHPAITATSALDDNVFLLSSKKCATSTRNLDMLFREGNITPRRVVECGSYPVLFSNIADGKGVSLVLRCSISDEIQQKIKIHPLTGEFNDFGIELLCRPEGTHFDLQQLNLMVASVFQDPRLRETGY